MSNTAELVKMLHDLLTILPQPGVFRWPRLQPSTSYICVLISGHERKFCKQNREGN